MNKFIPCKHLDYDESKYDSDTRVKTVPLYPEVRFWHRGERWTNNGEGQQPNPADVQFCKLRGRINGIFQCYFHGEMSCYEPELEIKKDNIQSILNTKGD